MRTEVSFIEVLCTEFRSNKVIIVVLRVLWKLTIAWWDSIRRLYSSSRVRADDIRVPLYHVVQDHCLWSTSLPFVRHIRNYSYSVIAVHFWYICLAALEDRFSENTDRRRGKKHRKRGQHSKLIKLFENAHVSRKRHKKIGHSWRAPP